MPLLNSRKHKLPGVYYALAEGYGELPIVDLAHPAFAVSRPNEAELSELVRHAGREQEKFNQMPAWLQRSFLWFFSRHSRLMRGLLKADGTYLSGLNTYLLKLGPKFFTGNLDQAVSSSFPALTARLRLQELVTWLAKTLAPELAARPLEPLHLLNIAGGPSSDSLNLLLQLQREMPELLSGRLIQIHVLDLESPGPEFAGRALAVLQAAGAPLQGLNASLVYVPYRWSEAQKLEKYLAGLKLKNAVVAVTSEGGLFDYGTPEEIVSNLSVLYAGTPDKALLGGTITPAGGFGRTFAQTSGAKTIPRTLEEFNALAAVGGWQVSQSADFVVNTFVGLRKKQRE